MSSFISLKQASTMTATYRRLRTEMLQPDFGNRNVLPICETFDKAQILAVLNRPDCAGLRVYYGMDDTQLVHAILVGVNEKDEDILPTGGEGATVDESIIEESTRCPDNCPPDSPLNS